LNVVGIVAALAAEARALSCPVWRRETLPAPVNDTLLTVSGIGAGAAATAARALIEAGATALTSWGMAGGLDPALRAGTVFLPSMVISTDGTAFATTAAWHERLSAAVASMRPVTRGKLLTSARAIDAVASKAAAFHDTGALAVDMESVAIAQVAASYGLPFIAVRVIVDTAHDVLPRAVISASDSGGVHIWRLLRALALAPADLAALVRLARRYRAASRSLTAVARAGPLARLAFPGVGIR
jgi:hopanoid-associated phosphorylase